MDVLTKSYTLPSSISLAYLDSGEPVTRAVILSVFFLVSLLWEVFPGLEVLQGVTSESILSVPTQQNSVVTWT